MMKSFVKEYDEFLDAVREGDYHGYNLDDGVELVWELYKGSKEQQDAQAYRDMKHVVAGLVYDIDHEPNDYSLDYQELVRQLDKGELV